MSLIIRREEEQDHRAVEELTREAFWNVYHPGATEHLIVHQLRDQKHVIKDLNLVAEVDGQLVGHILYVASEITADSTRLPSLTFGPFSISPEHQGRGYGQALLEHSLALAENSGAVLVAITGFPDYYSRFGFVKGKEVGIRYQADPEADYFLVKLFQPEALDDRDWWFTDPPGYTVDELVLEEFDKTFPYKEKLVLPGQLGQ
ncbi:N-acetyltransferase [Streptococcus suis]|uniref:GNAT family N-acetyltransferase n=1 Tax=Streptococcus suis TaxID=1307 RepID=UPI000CF64CFD|nr:N-acetyltransferase [Streptococcus suis]MBO3757109.1 N-acetyltransferase [Streptococcus suis]